MSDFILIKSKQQFNMTEKKNTQRFFSRGSLDHFSV
jgi:hypothetical protein